MNLSLVVLIRRFRLLPWYQHTIREWNILRIVIIWIRFFMQADRVVYMSPRSLSAVLSCTVFFWVIGFPSSLCCEHEATTLPWRLSPFPSWHTQLKQYLHVYCIKKTVLIDHSIMWYSKPYPQYFSNIMALTTM